MGWKRESLDPIIYYTCFVYICVDANTLFTERWTPYFSRRFHSLSVRVNKILVILKGYRGDYIRVYKNPPYVTLPLRWCNRFPVPKFRIETVKDRNISVRLVNWRDKNSF